MRYATGLLVLAACGGGTELPDGREARVDAPGPTIDSRVDANAPTADADTRLACLGDPAPGLTGPVTITGRVFEIVGYEATPLADAGLELRRLGTDAALAVATSGPDGAFTMTAGAPLDAYLVVGAPGRLGSFVYVEGDAMWTGQDALVFVATAAEVATWYADAGATYDDNSSTVLAVMRDCDRDAASGATLAVTPATPVVYYDESAMRWDPALTSASNGFALLANAPASPALEVTLEAAFPVEIVTSHPGAITMALVTPFD
jgi:hypothetical protein